MRVCESRFDEARQTIQANNATKPATTAPKPTATGAFNAKAALLLLPLPPLLNTLAELVEEEELEELLVEGAEVVPGVVPVVDAELELELMGMVAMVLVPEKDGTVEDVTSCSAIENGADMARICVALLIATNWIP